MPQAGPKVPRATPKTFSDISKIPPPHTRVQDVPKRFQCAKRPPRGSQEVSKRPRSGPKMLSTGAMMPPRCPKRFPRVPKSLTRGPQEEEASRWPQDAPKRGLRGPKRSQDAPKRTQDAAQRLQYLHHHGRDYDDDHHHQTSVFSMNCLTDAWHDCSTIFLIGGLLD